MASPKQLLDSLIAQYGGNEVKDATSGNPAQRFGWPQSDVMDLEDCMNQVGNAHTKRLVDIIIDNKVHFNLTSGRSQWDYQACLQAIQDARSGSYNEPASAAQSRLNRVQSDLSGTMYWFDYWTLLDDLGQFIFRHAHLSGSDVQTVGGTFAQAVDEVVTEAENAGVMDPVQADRMLDDMYDIGAMLDGDEQLLAAVGGRYFTDLRDIKRDQLREMWMKYGAPKNWP